MKKLYGTFGVEMRAYGQKLVEIGQKLVRNWSEIGQKLVRNWSNFAHTQVTVTVFKT